MSTIDGAKVDALFRAIFELLDDPTDSKEINDLLVAALTLNFVFLLRA